MTGSEGLRGRRRLLISLLTEINFTDQDLAADCHCTPSGLCDGTFPFRHVLGPRPDGTRLLVPGDTAEYSGPGFIYTSWNSMGKHVKFVMETPCDCMLNTPWNFHAMWGNIMKTPWSLHGITWTVHGVFIYFAYVA